MEDPEILVGKREFQELYDSLVEDQEQFKAWFEEAALLEAEIETEELRPYVAQIKKDRQRYRQLITQRSQRKNQRPGPARPLVFTILRERSY